MIASSKTPVSGVRSRQPRQVVKWFHRDGRQRLQRGEAAPAGVGGLFALHADPLRPTRYRKRQ